MTKQNFKNYLNITAKMISMEMQSYLDTWNKEYAHESRHLGSLLMALQESSSGGKRVRGTLIYLAYSHFLGRKLSLKEEKAILRVAVAYEIFQTAILAHDDVIDQSAQRRNKPSMYQQLGGNHYGISQTICIGDLGFFMAYKIIAESQFSDKVKTKALTFFSDAITKTVLGQMLDVSFSQEKKRTERIDDVIEVYKLKTAYYTFVGPLSLGAILAGVDEKMLKQLKLFGENIGILFQIHDDIADIFPHRNISNKDIGADIKEGKVTLLYLRALKNANKQQKMLLEKHYGKNTVSKIDLQNVQTVFRETGALDAVLELAETYEIQARKLIGTFVKDEKTKQLFSELVDYVSRKEEKRDE